VSKAIEYQEHEAYTEARENRDPCSHSAIPELIQSPEVVERERRANWWSADLPDQAVADHARVPQDHRGTTLR